MTAGLGGGRLFTGRRYVSSTPAFAPGGIKTCPLGMGTDWLIRLSAAVEMALSVDYYLEFAGYVENPILARGVIMKNLRNPVKLSSRV